MATQLINPQNPYVLNEYMYANQPHFNFNDSNFALLLRCANIIVPSLGIMCTLLVVYLALFQTPTHIKAFSRMLLLCSMSDIVYAVCDLWCQARFQVSRTGIMFTFTGLVSLFSYQVQCHSLSVKYAAHTLSYLVLPVQYIFRYQTLKRNSPPDLFTTLSYVFVCLLISSLSIFTAENGFCSFENPNHADFGQHWYKEVPIPKLLVGMQDYPPAVRQVTFFSLATFFSYALAVFYARKTLTELRKQATYMSIRTMNMQKQIGRTLFAQSLTPLLTAIIPVMLAQMSLRFGLQLGYFNDIHFILMTFFPLLNSLSTLYFIVPYRNYCLKIFLPCFYSAFKRPDMSLSLPPGANPNSLSTNVNRVEPSLSYA